MPKISKKNQVSASKKQSAKNSFSPLASFLPNIVTLTALCIALSAVKYAINGDFYKASAFLLFAGFMDGVDGRLARYLDSTSEFGAQLDSLVDFVNFGVVPGFLVYFWLNVNYDIKFFDWGLVLFFAVCGAVRLARFNVDLANGQNSNPILEKYFFKGVPAPVGAAMSMLPLVLTYEFGVGFYSEPYLVMVYMLLIALLMASVVPTISIKKIPIRNDYAYLTLVIMATIVIGLIIKPWLTLALVGSIYALSIPVTMVCYFIIAKRRA